MADSSNDTQFRDRSDIANTDPQSKRGKQGEARHDHQEAGPNSDSAGETIAPQMGDRKGTDTPVGGSGR